MRWRAGFTLWDSRHLSGERRHPTGFTLTEVLMAVVIIGILASAATPQYVKTVERAYLRETDTLLLTIYAGEQVYFSTSDTYHVPPPWRDIFMDDPNIASVPVTFTVAAAGSGATATFTATATRNGGGCDGATRTIDESRTPGGTWPTCPVF